MNPNLPDRPVFICGHPKSGTSLLRAMLDSHPELLVYPEETVFFRRYLPKARGKTLEEKLVLADELLLHIFSWNQIAPPPSQKDFPDRDYSDVPFPKVREAYRQLAVQRLRHDGDLLFNALAAYGMVTDNLYEETHRWVEKTPYNERFVKQILAWWPEALFIHVIRDPRDNYATYKRKHPEWSVESFARSWRDSTQEGLAYQARLGSQHYWVMRYEDLVRHPEEYIQKICTFLGIQDDPTLRRPTRNGKDWGGNSMFGERFQGIDTTPLERWKQSLSIEETLITEWNTASTMQQLNYPASETGWQARLAAISPRLIKAWIATKILGK
jgi:hypothetical protein